jgi:hypothetical protein
MYVGVGMAEPPVELKLNIDEPDTIMPIVIEPGITQPNVVEPRIDEPNVGINTAKYIFTSKKCKVRDQLIN